LGRPDLAVLARAELLQPVQLAVRLSVGEHRRRRESVGDRDRHALAVDAGLNQAGLAVRSLELQRVVTARRVRLELAVCLGLVGRGLLPEVGRAGLDTEPGAGRRA